MLGELVLVSSHRFGSQKRKKRLEQAQSCLLGPVLHSTSRFILLTQLPDVSSLLTHLSEASSLPER